MESLPGFPKNFKPANGFADADQTLSTLEVSEMIFNNSGVRHELTSIYQWLIDNNFLQKTLDTKIVWLIAAE